jgi:UDP-N-acetylmuramate dehydrogenase
VINVKIEENITLAPYTTMQIGGRARFFVSARSEEEVIAAVRFAAENDFPLFVLGGGSNVVISDHGFDGLVLHIATEGVSADSDADSLRRITAQAGEPWDGFVERTVIDGLAGLECLSGIPGSVGGTPVQNVGAYGQDVSETIISVRVLDRVSFDISELTNAECGFGYRTSIFNTSERERYIVLAVTYGMTPGGEPKIAYKDLRDHFGDHNPTLSETRDAVLAIRRAKSMVIDVADPNSKSAGSFFKNPVISKQMYAALAAQNDAIPSFPVGETQVKIPAAWLIENAGFHKGYVLGKAGISTRHTLAIINLEGTAADIMVLKEQIVAVVKKKFGIALLPEPVFVGF